DGPVQETRSDGEMTQGTAGSRVVLRARLRDMDDLAFRLVWGRRCLSDFRASRSEEQRKRQQTTETHWGASSGNAGRNLTPVPGPQQSGKRLAGEPVYLPSLD